MAQRILDFLDELTKTRELGLAAVLCRGLLAAYMQLRKLRE